MNWLGDLWEKLHQIQHDLNWVKRKQDQVLSHLNLVLDKEDKIMAIEDDLAAAITDLGTALNSATSEIDKLLAKITAGNPSPAIQASIDQIKALTQSINDEVAKAEAQVP